MVTDRHQAFWEMDIYGFTLLDAVEEEAAACAVVGVENRGAGLSENLLWLPAGDLFGGAIEGCDPPFGVNGEDPVRDVVEDEVAVARVDDVLHVSQYGSCVPNLQ